MRKITLLLIFMASPLYSQWVAQNSGVTANLNDVYCISPEVVVVVGDAGTILKTADGGANWITKNSGTTQKLQKVQFVDANTGFAVGWNGTLLKTTDSGENWSAIATGFNTDLYGLSALTENTFYLSGANGLLKKTIDGGGSFETQTTSETEIIADIEYLNEQTGYIKSGLDLGSKLLKTIDGGTNWTLIDFATSFYFLDENVGFMSGSNGLAKTTDGGLNFSYLDGSFATHSDIFSLDANKVWKTDYSLMLCGCITSCITKGDATEPGNYQDISNCNIGSTTADGIPFEAIHFANETTGFVVGWGGAIFKNATGLMLNVSETDKKDALKIYPNPASGQFTISFGEMRNQPFAVKIADTLGKTVYSESYQPAEFPTVNIESLLKGFYLLTVESNGKTQNQKIIVD